MEERQNESQHTPGTLFQPSLMAVPLSYLRRVGGIDPKRSPCPMAHLVGLSLTEFFFCARGDDVRSCQKGVKASHSHTTELFDN